MKARKFSQAPLVIGLLLGLAALWIGTAPATGAGGGVIGGFTYTWADGVRVAATSSSCTYCDYSTNRPCSEYNGPYGCLGGYIAVAHCVGLADTTHSAGKGGCWSSADPVCTELYDATCY